VRLSAPRRYGKTSLLRRIGRDAEKIGMNYVEVWEQTPVDQEADAECWQRTVAKVFAEHDEALRATWDSLETKEQAVYAALAVGGAGLFAERTLTRFNLSKSSARYAREALVRGGRVRQVDGGWRPVDPLLARWSVELQHNGGEDLLR